MRIIKHLFIVSVLFFTGTLRVSAQKNIVHDFKLQGVNDSMYSLSDFPDARGFIIVFTGNTCPFAKLYYERLNDMNSKYSLLGVPLIAIRSTDTLIIPSDGFDEMKILADAKHFTFPYLADNTQAVAKEFKADHTPHAVVIWKSDGQWVIEYSGAIDDNGAEKEKVKHSWCADAVDALISGKEPAVKETKSVGCAIHFR